MSITDKYPITDGISLYNLSIPSFHAINAESHIPPMAPANSHHHLILCISNIFLLV